MYYQEKSYNGVLFLLREPHVAEEDKDKTVEEITKKSDEWVGKMLNKTFTEADWKDKKDAKVSKASATKYRNRFIEILSAIGINEKELPHIAYDNIYKQGGGSTQSKGYKEALKKYEKANFDDLLENLSYKTNYVFTCRDIYSKLKSVLEITEETDGLRYNNSEHPFKAFTYTDSKANKLTVFEIFHPCFYVTLNK